MGREIRKVPANWEHPRSQQYPDRLQPMYDQTFVQAVKKWKEGFTAWENGERADPDFEYWEWHGAPPEREYYRPWEDADATWFQVWETVSEGTPVSPPFPTREELINYLATYGDYWDQQRKDPPWNREAAAKFVNAGWAPSMFVVIGGPDAGIYTASTGFPNAHSR